MVRRKDDSRYLLPWVSYETGIESVNFKYAELHEMTRKYDPGKLKDGFNTMPDGEKIFYISNPALGLWAYQDRFK